MRVYDEHGLVSNWVSGTDLTTSVHHYPSFNFTWIPIRPNTNETVLFTDTSKCWDEDVVYGADCSTATGDTFEWTFLSGAPASSTAENPIIEFTAPGNYNVTLEVTDRDGYTCTLTQPIRVDYPMPKWREIRPW